MKYLAPIVINSEIESGWFMIWMKTRLLQFAVCKGPDHFHFLHPKVVCEDFFKNKKLKKKIRKVQFQLTIKWFKGSVNGKIQIDLMPYLG